jgi:hypothetical protein
MKKIRQQVIGILAFSVITASCFMAVAISFLWLEENHYAIFYYTVMALIASIPLWVVYGWAVEQRHQRQARKWYDELAKRDGEIRRKHRETYSKQKGW